MGLGYQVNRETDGLRGPRGRGSNAADGRLAHTFTYVETSLVGRRSESEHAVGGREDHPIVVGFAPYHHLQRLWIRRGFDPDGGYPYDAGPKTLQRFSQLLGLRLRPGNNHGSVGQGGDTNRHSKCFGSVHVP